MSLSTSTLRYQPPKPPQRSQRHLVDVSPPSGVRTPAPSTDHAASLAIALPPAASQNTRYGGGTFVDTTTSKHPAPETGTESFCRQLTATCAPLLRFTPGNVGHGAVVAGRDAVVATVGWTDGTGVRPPPNPFVVLVPRGGTVPSVDEVDGSRPELVVGLPASPFP